MDEIHEMKKKLAKEKRELKADIERTEKEKEKKKLKQELRDVRLAKVKVKMQPATSFFGSLSKVGGQITENLERNQARQEYDVEAGDHVTITNGMYAGKTMRIFRFIPGGIEGRIGQNTVRIRNGSYRR